MPRFFFHVYDDIEALDAEGLELPGVEAATAEGVRNARVLASEEVRRGHLRLDHRIEVTDESGAVVANIRFRDAVAVEA